MQHAIVPAEPFNFGAWLKGAVGTTGLAVKEFAAKAGCSEGSLHRWFGLRAPPIEEAYRGRLAKALGVPKTELDLLLKMASEGKSATSVGRLLTSLRVPARDSSESNLQLSTLRELRPIPTWDLAIAAGGWIEVPIAGELDYADPAQRSIIEQGLFRIRIAGDSMEPDWLSGDVVEFQLFRPDRDELVVGQDYAVVRSDRTGTFKRLIAVTEEYLVLRAVNAKRYPTQMKVACSEIVRMAIAKGIFIGPRRPR